MSNRKLAKNVGVMSAAISVSRVLGLVRDLVMANYFGATYLNDAYNAAYVIPNLLRRLFGEGALSSAFVPIYNEIGITRGKQAQVYFALNLLSILTFFLMVLTAFGMVFAPQLVKLLYPGFAPQTSALAAKLCLITFPYLFFIGLSSTFIAILNSHDYFFMTGLSTALLNIGMLFTLWIPVWTMPITNENLIYFAAWGVVVGGFLQTVVNFPYLKKIGYHWQIILKFHGEAITALWKRFIPALAAIGIREIGLIADGLLISFLPIGSLTVLGYGNRLMQLPLGIFAISTGTALLPLYSRYTQEKKWKELSESLRFSTISLAAVMLPITAIIAALGLDFIKILFEHGQFTHHASVMTYQALLCYSFGLIFFSLNQTLTPLFFAFKDTKTPMFIAAYIVLMNISLNIILMVPLKHMGLALSSSLTAMLNFIVMMHIFRKRMPQITYDRVFFNVMKLVILSFAVYGYLAMVNHYLVGSGRIFLIVKDTLLSISAFILFFIGCRLIRVEYTQQVITTLWRKFHRT